MKKICIIMADGQAKRMKGLNKKKQLIKIDGQPVIERTINQLKNLGVTPVIATHFADFDYLDIKHIIPENNIHEITKFNANKKYYQEYDEVLFIWGDTYFDDCDIKEIVETPTEKYTFFGSDYEIFGFKIKKPYYHLIDEASDYIINKKDLDYGNTGTWGLLRYIGNFPLLPNPDKENMKLTKVTSLHEPDKYSSAGLLHKLHGLSIDNDGKKDLEILCMRFPNAKVEELIYENDNGSKEIFKDKKWQPLN